MTRFWKAGDYVVLREIWRGQVRSGRPYTVVEDTPSRLVLYAGAGVRWMRPVGPDGTPLRMRGPSWTLREEVSTQESLRIITPGSRHSIILFWTEGFQELLQWYVNLEEPLVRTPIGFDYLDQMLDIVVASDLSEWTWKDEDELEATVARGILSTEEADVIRAEGERVIEALNAGVPRSTSHGTNGGLTRPGRPPRCRKAGVTSAGIRPTEAVADRTSEFAEWNPAQQSKRESVTRTG